jgi:two-component system sensor histidine kinase PilS (NtrC family)
LSSNFGVNFLSNSNLRRTIRIVTLFIYFIVFQSLILLQKPFLQLDFILVFYYAFGGLFAHHLFHLLYRQNDIDKNSGLLSYLFDFLILILFMKYFSYLSSFILVLQLFLLFVASFDLDFFELAVLGFIASLGASLINLSAHQSGSIQSILSLTLFNLSYLSVIIVSRQLKVEFLNLQTDLTQTRRKWKSQEEFSKTLIEKLPFGLAVLNKNDFILKNSYLKEKLSLSENRLNELIKIYNGRSQKVSNSDFSYVNEAEEKRIFNFDQTNYFDEEINENLDIYLIRDVTEIRALENQLKLNEKLAAVGTLAAGIAHEIRNPLAGISGSIQMLSQDSADPTQQKLMNIILREIDRLNILITEFLDYAKPEKAPDSVINLMQIIEDVISSTRSHPDVSEKFKWNVDLKPAHILGFTEKLKQAFLNIIINAIQAMKTSENASLEIKMFTDDKHAILSIKDTGSGMSEETKKKMFEPFHTTKPKGTGLGLAITHKILDTHKALIEVNTALNVGTEFIIKFPLKKGE